MRVIIISLKPHLYYCLQFFFLYIYILRGASAVGRAYIRARRSRRGRWCRFLHGIVPGRDTPGSEPTTPLGHDARGSRGCTLAVRTFIQRGTLHPMHTRAHVDTVSSWIWPRARRFARDIRDDESGYQTTQYEARSLRVYEHCPTIRVG